MISSLAAEAVERRDCEDVVDLSEEAKAREEWRVVEQRPVA
jgi:hypothetical protein